MHTIAHMCTHVDRQKQTNKPLSKHHPNSKRITVRCIRCAHACVEQSRTKAERERERGGLTDPQSSGRPLLCATVTGTRTPSAEGACS